MQLDHLDQLSPRYQHVYLSPHLDDAALSCGGAMVTRRAAGEGVLVVTLCTAAPAPEAPLSALAQEFHDQWCLSAEQAVTARLVEEREAMARLHVDYYWAGMLDAIYRFPQAYGSRESLFGTPAPDDPQWHALREFLHRLREQLPHATFYAPLGIGSHVDHLITHRVALDVAGERLAFYEDTPYVLVPGAFEQRMLTIEQPLAPHTIAIDAALSTKITAIAAYTSQMGELFGGESAMRDAITTYAARVRPATDQYGERVWMMSEKVEDKR